MPILVQILDMSFATEGFHRGLKWKMTKNFVFKSALSKELRVEIMRVLARNRMKFKIYHWWMPASTLVGYENAKLIWGKERL